MKFDAKTFVRESDAAFSVAKESPLVPIFEYVLISPAENGVLLTATNYGHSIRVVAACTTPPLKAFCIFAPSLWPILKTLDGEVEIVCQDKVATVTCGGTSLEVPCLPGKDFPAQDAKGGDLAMSVDIVPFLKMVGDLSFFLEPEDGINIGKQNILVWEKGCYASDFVATLSVSGLYTSKTPFLFPPSVRNRMSSFTGKWDIFTGPGWIRFSQGDSFYRKSTGILDVSAAAGKIHSVIATAANANPLASFEVARIAPAIARAVLVGGHSSEIKGNGLKICVKCKSHTTGSVLEEVIPTDGATFDTTMPSRTIHGIFDIVGYGGLVIVSPQTSPDKLTWPPSLIIKDTEKKFMALVGPITTGK